MTSLPGPYPEERRLATVLFADVQGFTALADRLDFEAVSDLIKEVWLRVDTVIEAHGGYIDKHMGDAVMAVWGAPHAGEDDAERAVAAALEMQAALAEYARESPREGANELRLRVGLNTGPVLSGYVGLRSEYTVMGDTVNIARRLEQTAETGTVVISETTYRLVRGAFQVRRLPPLHLKGKSEPVLAFVVMGVLEHPGRLRYRGAGGLETHMVAREAELARLEALYLRARSAPRPTLVLVVGEAGLGKSRLLMEFTSRLEVDKPDLTLMTARGLAQMARVSFYLWKSLWHTHFCLSDDDPPEVAREKFLRGVRSLWGQQLGPASAVEAAHLIGDLTGLEWPGSPYLDAPKGRARRAFELSRELLRRACTAGPVVVLLDDLHWVDTGSLDLLTFLLRPAPEPLPLLILAAARPELLRQQPHWARLAEVISLQPLPINPELVAAAYPDLRSWPEEVLTELARRTEGNPYYLEEMVKSLVQSGLVGHGQSGREMVARLQQHLPQSLLALQQARLDALSPEARGAALLAAVEGRVFWVGAVVATAMQVGSITGILRMPARGLTERIQDALAQLTRAEMAFPRAGSELAGEQEYIFKHSLLREVAYSLLPHKYRRQCHLAVARWLASRAGPDFHVVVADHFERAGAILEAARHYEQAARYARSRGATADAMELHSYARDLRERLNRVGPDG